MFIGKLLNFFAAQLMAIGTGANKTAPSLETIVLEKIHNLCETYQKRQLNTWGSTSSNAIGECDGEGYLLNIRWADAVHSIHLSHAVARYLLSSRFWSATVKNDNLIYGNLSSTLPVTITLENFSNRIDLGSPTPEESGTICFAAPFLFISNIHHFLPDDCLAELLSQPHCVASSRCLEIMSPRSESHGYHLTHK